MALVMKKMFQGYFYLMNDVADQRAEDLFLMSSPLPTIGIIVLWFMFIFKLGPEYMKDREPLNLKNIMIVYNIGQVVFNLYVLYYLLMGIHTVNWKCAEVDYSRSYWALTFLWLTHKYFLLKLVDLLDTVFFVLRKKTTHLSFLHVYHHFGMCVVGWVGTKFLAGGHVYFVGLANCAVHAILYGYYLLTAYDSKYTKMLWLKKFITQTQLFQFLFLLVMFSELLFVPGCNFPKMPVLFFIPQNFFMVVLFSDFYYRTYYLAPKNRRKELEKKMQELQVEDAQEKKNQRAEDLFLMSSPLPMIGITVLWFMFIFKWGPEYMKDREPLNLKNIMIVYNIGQVVFNLYVLYYLLMGSHTVNWKCAEIDYSKSYWGITFLWLAHKYFILKLVDLIDTVFFVLRKKTTHLSFLHVYHHFGMCLAGWIGTKFVGGGHVYFVGLANCPVHAILYGYYLLTAYDSNYTKLLWLKKFITQIQLFQFLFLVVMFSEVLFVPGCNFPKIVVFIFLPQNFFMVVLFSDFYYRTYYLAPKNKRKELEKKMQELQVEDAQEKKIIK